MKKIITLFAISIISLTQAQSWYQVSVPTNEKLNDIQFVNDSVGWIAGNNGTLLKTFNGGASWTAMTINGINAPGSYDIIDIEFIDEMTGFMITDVYVSLYKTVDGGLNWVEDVSTLGNQCYKKALYAFNENHMFMGGAGCFEGVIMAELLSGTWAAKSTNMSSFNPAEYISFIDFSSTYALATTSTRYMLRSTDGGQNWDSIPTPVSVNGFLTEVKIIDDTLAFAGYNDNGGGFGVLVTHDAGLSWSQDFNMATFYYPAYWSVHQANNGDVYFGAEPSFMVGGLMFEMSNSIWTYEEVEQPIYAIDSYMSDVTFGVGDSGYVIVNQLPSMLGVNSLNSIEFTMYPNPSVNELYITLPKAESFEFRIVDLAGNVVMEGYRNADSNHTLNIGRMEPGRYLVELKTSNGQLIQQLIKQ